MNEVKVATDQALSSLDLAEFETTGLVAIPGAFSDDTAKRCEHVILEALRTESGVNLSDPGKVRHSVSRRAHPEFDAILTPRVAEAFDTLAGQDLWNKDHLATHGNFWVTFPGFHGDEWKVPSGHGRWHIDLGYESRESFVLSDGNCAFVAAFLITDSRRDGAPTVAIPGSHRLIARILHLAQRPVGRFEMVAFCEGYATSPSIAQTVVQMTGKAGDVVIMHPLLIHCASAHVGSSLRILSNTGIGLRGGRRLADTDMDRSVIEESIRNSIGTLQAGGVRSALVRLLLVTNHRLWTWRYAVSGKLPSLQEPELPLRRRIPERMLRGVCAALSSLIVRLAG